MKKYKRILKSAIVSGAVILPFISMAAACETVANKNGKDAGIVKFNVTDLSKPFDDGIYRSRLPMGAYRKMLPLGKPVGKNELFTLALRWEEATHKKALGMGHPKTTFEKIKDWEWAYCVLTGTNEVVNFYAIYDSKVFSLNSEDKAWKTNQYLDFDYAPDFSYL